MSLGLIHQYGVTINVSVTCRHIYVGNKSKYIHSHHGILIKYVARLSTILAMVIKQTDYAIGHNKL